MDEQKDNSISKELDIAKKNGANMLMPTISISQGLSQFMTPVVDSVYLSSVAEDGDIYPEKSTENAKLRITAQGLKKLAVCANLTWHPTACHRTDNRQDKNYCSFQSVGGIKKNDGTVVWWRGDYDLDMEVVLEELRELHRQKCSRWHKTDAEKQAYIDSSVKRDYLFKSKHRLKLCQTGSENRVIRSVLGLKSAFTKKELSKPFVMVRYVFSPDLSDPIIKSQVTAAAIQAMSGIYGSAQPAPLPQPIDVPPENYEVHEVPDEEGPPPPSKDPEPTPEPDNQEPTSEEVFQDLSAKEQISTLEAIAERKGYEPKQPIEQLAESDRLSFLEALNKLPDVEKVDKDDIPF